MLWKSLETLEKVLYNMWLVNLRLKNPKWWVVSQNGLIAKLLRIHHVSLRKNRHNLLSFTDHVEYTGSRPITKVKLRRAWLVFGWETFWFYV